MNAICKLQWDIVSANFEPTPSAIVDYDVMGILPNFLLHTHYSV